MSKPRRNFIPMPFYPLAVDTSPQERMFILALYHHDWDGVLAFPSQKRIGQIMGCSPDTVARTQAKLEKRGWIKISKKKGNRNQYDMNIPEMTLDEFNEFLKRPQNAATLDLRQPQDADSESRMVRPGEPQDAASLINRTNEAEPVSRTKGLKHADEKKFWDESKAIWSKRFPGQELRWPGQPGSAPIKDFQKLLTAQLVAVGCEELARRWSNCVNAPWGQPSMRSFIYDTDKWVKDPNEKKGGTGARAFHAPPTDWQPTHPAK